eukprot:3605835-Rhodomonas_salina.3
MIELPEGDLLCFKFDAKVHWHPGSLRLRCLCREIAALPSSESTMSWRGLSHSLGVPDMVAVTAR